MIIAVDFDGTIVEHKYPAIGKEIPFAIDTLKMLQKDRHRLILWSVREGKLLDEAVQWCKERGVEFYAVNRDYPEETTDNNPNFSRKLKVDVFIDDRNLGCPITLHRSLSDKVFVDWKKVEKDYEYYDPKKSGTVNWLMLIVETKSL